MKLFNPFLQSIDQHHKQSVLWIKTKKQINSTSSKFRFSYPISCKKKNTKTQMHFNRKVIKLYESRRGHYYRSDHCSRTRATVASIAFCVLLHSAVTASHIKFAIKLQLPPKIRECVPCDAIWLLIETIQEMVAFIQAFIHTWFQGITRFSVYPV